MNDTLLLLIGNLKRSDTSLCRDTDLFLLDMAFSELEILISFKPFLWIFKKFWVQGLLCIYKPLFSIIYGVSIEVDALEKFGNYERDRNTKHMKYHSFEFQNSQV